MFQIYSGIVQKNCKTCFSEVIMKLLQVFLLYLMLTWLQASLETWYDRTLCGVKVCEHLVCLKSET